MKKAFLRIVLQPCLPMALGTEPSDRLRHHDSDRQIRWLTIAE
jgi:hypothetical protein